MKPVFDSDLLSTRDRLELSREFLASSYRLEPLSEIDLRAQASILDIGVARLTQGFLSSASLQRKADEVTAHSEEQVSLFLTTGGRWRGDAGKRAKEIGPGQMVLLDRSQGLGGKVESLSSITLVLPKRVILENVPELEDLHGETLTGPMAALLTDHVRSVVRHGDGLDASARTQLGRMTSDLVLGALAGDVGERLERASPALTRALVGRAKRYVRAHCCEPRLSPESVAAAVGASRSALYRAFEPEGGVARYIRQARLEAARTALVNGDDPRRIGEIAFAYGFTSEAQFSRAVRAAFGASPRDLRHGTDSRLRV